MNFVHPRLLGIGALLLATTGWGGMFLVSKDVLQHVDALWFTVIRYGVSGAALALLLAPRGAAPWRKLRAQAGALALRGLAGFGAFSVLLLVGLAHSVPSHGAVIIATVPMTTQLLRWALDGVRPARSALLTAALALAGVVVVSGILLPAARAGESTLVGDLIALVGTLGWILYTRGAARHADLDVIEYTALTVLASWPVLVLAAALGTLVGVAHVPSAVGLAQSWHALLYVGLISSAVSVLAFNHGVRALGTVTATAFLNFVPVSVLLIGLAMGKTPAVHEVVGVAMVVTALLVHSAASRSVRAPAHAQAASGAPPALARTCPAAS